MSFADTVAGTELQSEVCIRQRIIDAALILAIREQAIPTPENLSVRTGISEEQITDIYPGLDELAADIRVVATERYKVLEDAMPEDADLDTMLVTLVDLRSSYYEAVGELRQLGDAGEGFLPSLVKAKAVREGKYRGRLMECFSTHFGTRTQFVVPKIELLTSWETWRHLRSVQCLTKDQSSALVCSLLRDVTAAV